MDSALINEILKIYPEYHTVYGPYKRKEDNRNIIILYDGSKRSARLLAKVLLEIKIGRKLIGNETVDHIDDDNQNDHPDNLQILDKSKNSSKSALKAIYGKAICAICFTEFQMTVNQANSKKAGPFCSKVCKGVYGSSLQHGKIDQLYSNKDTTKYYK